MTIIAEFFDRDCSVLKSQNGTIVGYAIKLSTGRWGLTDANENRIGRLTFKNSEHVRQAMERYLRDEA